MTIQAMLQLYLILFIKIQNIMSININTWNINKKVMVNSFTITLLVIKHGHYIKMTKIKDKTKLLAFI